VALLVVTMPGIEDALDGTLQLLVQQGTYQSLVEELHFGQGESDPANGVVTQPTHFGAIRAGHGDRVPRV
jgi:hypothetical protein